MSATVQRKNLDVATVPLRGVQLIEASAGTGKTYTITSLVVRLLVERRLSIDKILAVTFTNAATSELKDRVHARLIEARAVVHGLASPGDDPLLNHLLSLEHQKGVRHQLDQALLKIDSVGIFTIHGFAARMLKEYAFESVTRQGLELILDQRPLIFDVVTDFWSTRIATLSKDEFQAVGGEHFYSVLRSVGLAAAGAIEVPLIKLQPSGNRQELLALLKEKYERAREQFEEQGAELLQILLETPSLSRVSYKEPSLLRDYQLYREYFKAEVGSQGHPETELFTQEKVEKSTKKKQKLLQHPLLKTLGDLRQCFFDLAQADSHFADALRFELCEEISRRIQREHARAGTQSFDGLLLDLATALRDPSLGPRLAQEIRRVFPVALIDEFQDTDPLQYEIFSRIYQPTSGETKARNALFLIGDPKQSIYSFRGADVGTYLKAQNDAEALWTLTVSYRASPRLVQAQNAIFASSPAPFGTTQIAYDLISAPPSAHDSLTDSEGQALPGLVLVELEGAVDDLAQQTAREIANFLALRPMLGDRLVCAGDIAVLTRTNRQAAEVQDALRLVRIPAVLHGDRSVFESSEARELRRVLRALAEPTHRTLVRTALATRAVGLSAEQLLHLDEDAPALETWSQRVRTWGDLWRNRGVAHAVAALQADTSFLSRTLAVIDGERRVTNFRHLIELLHDAEQSEHLGITGLLRWLDTAIFDPSSHSMADEVRQLRLESDASAVTLTTSHRSKGLEYGIVFLPSIGIPDRGRKSQAFRYFDDDLGEPRLEMRDLANRHHSEEIRKQEEQQESLRLAYVALTRAKHHVVALLSPQRSFSPLGYLLHDGGGGQSGLSSFGERFKALAEAQRAQQIADFVARSQGTIVVRPASLYSVNYLPSEKSVGQIFKPDAVPARPESERTSSFSSMTRDAPQGLSRAAREGKDVDEQVLPTEDQLAGEARRAVPGTQTLSSLAEFPRGAGPGDALHAAFEHCGFADSSPEERALEVERQLKRRGFTDSDVASLQIKLEEVLQVPLADPHPQAGATVCKLGELNSFTSIAEMEFSLVVGDPECRLSASGLARALGYVDELTPRDTLAVKGPEWLSKSYLQQVYDLPFSAWSGFLRGFIDLTFEHEGRLYALDYKSNYLGPHLEDYNPERLSEAMEHHHYFLQALLYALALHRYGQVRIPGYEYETHFGGMHYLFVRGMHPDHAQSGVLSFRPSCELIERLDRTLLPEMAQSIEGEGT